MVDRVWRAKWNKKLSSGELNPAAWQGTVGVDSAGLR
jgi:hypothetical protein